MENKTIKLGLIINTVSPIAVIEESVVLPEGKTVVRLKRETYMSEDNSIKTMPIIPANTIRGGLRRLATKRIIETLESKSKDAKFCVKSKDLHAMLSGSGATDSPITFSEEKQLREKNPLLSLFGTGLLLSGKIKITNARPGAEDRERSIVRVESSTKTDDIVRKSQFSKLFTRDQIVEYEKNVLETQKLRAGERSAAKEAKEAGVVQADTKKTKKAGVQHFFGKEYILSGTRLDSNIKLENLTDIELGMFLTALADFAAIGEIGSSRNVGYGIIDVQIINSDNSNLLLNKVSSQDNIYKAIIENNFSDDKVAKDAIDAYNKWLKNVTLEDIEALSAIKK